MTRAHNQAPPVDEHDGMTLSPQESQEWEATPEAEEIEYHVPVTQINTPPAARNGIHYTVLTSTSLNPVQLLVGRDYDRVKAYITAVDYPVVIAESREKAQAATNESQIVSSTMQSIVVQGQATDPGAGGTIVSTSALTAGTTYTVAWSVTLEGTVTTADANNMQIIALNLNAAPDAFYPGAVGTYPQTTVTATPTGNTATVKAIAAASGASAIYAAQVIFTPLAATAGALSAVPSGQIIPVGSTLPIEHCDEVWLAACSANTGRVSVEVCRTERASA
jgi:hypothetical protein